MRTAPLLCRRVHREPARGPEVDRSELSAKQTSRRGGRFHPPAPRQFQILRQGSEFNPDLTVFAKLKPVEASQLIDHVMAPRMLGYVLGGTNELQLVPLARQLSALLTTEGTTKPPPAALPEAGRPRPTWSGRNPFSS